MNTWFSSECSPGFEFSRGGLYGSSDLLLVALCFGLMARGDAHRTDARLVERDAGYCACLICSRGRAFRLAFVRSQTTFHSSLRTGGTTFVARSACARVIGNVRW
ncbi:hypothetical protein C8Q76DRAFT_753303 [Earliella scabrosa]|nr:hypothetical protein C8Q76DRAFT_753303 [Earliella scabrosa]